MNGRDIDKDVRQRKAMIISGFFALSLFVAVFASLSLTLLFFVVAHVGVVDVVCGGVAVADEAAVVVLGLL